MRDSAHKALNAVVKVAGASLEAHLSSIIGCWVAGMADPHAPSAASARSAFVAAFSSEKQAEVFCLMLKALLSVSSVNNSSNGVYSHS